MGSSLRSKPALLCVTPHFGNSLPPAGAAALLSYMQSNGCADFAFCDFRTWLPYRCKTFSEMGAFGETFVLDVPELPIVLKMLKAFREGKKSIVPERDRLFDDYCMQRLLNPRYLHQYLVTLERFFETAWQQFGDVKFVGFTTWTTNYLSTLIAAAQLKRTNKDVYIVAGGPQVTESTKSAALGIESGIFDAAVLGEGEQALFELYAEFTENGNNAGGKHIPGVLKHSAWKKEEENQKRKLLALKSLPPPRFDEIDLSAYWGWREHRMLPYQLSRGCTDKCSFCSEWVFWQNFRLSKADLSVEQIKELQQRYDLRHVSFTDSLVNGVGRRLEAFAENLLSSEIDITWGGFMRAQMTPELGGLIKRAGCNFAFVGVESLSDETLDSMNKRRTGIDNVQAIEAFVSAEVPVEVGLITGFPGDSRDRFKETVRGVIALQSRFPGRVRINVESFRPTPNQPIYGRLQEFGLEPMIWNDETLDLDPSFIDITGDMYCQVTGSNQGLDRLGELSYVTKVIKSGPKPSVQNFAIGWGRPEILDFENELVKFHTFTSEDLQGWYSVRALHPDGSVRFLIMHNKEVQKLNSVLREVDFDANPFEHGAFETTWAALVDKHLVPGAIHPAKAATHYFQADLQDDSLLSASPYWAVRIIGHSEDGMVMHNLHDVAKCYRTTPALAPFLETVAGQATTWKELVDSISGMEKDFDRQDVIGVLEASHEFGILSVV